MAWVDLQSPALKQHLNNWCLVRGARRVAGIDSFDEYIRSIDPNFLATIGANKKRECVFTSLGANISVLFPGCTKGLRFSDVNPLPVRLGLTRLLQEVFVDRQPGSRRSTYRQNDAMSFYEQLFLPFVDKDFDVRLIAIIADGYSVQGSAV